MVLSTKFRSTCSPSGMIYYGPAKTDTIHELSYYYNLLWIFFGFFSELIFPKNCIFFSFFRIKIRRHLVKGVLLWMVFCKKYMEINYFLLLSCSLEKQLLVEWFFNYSTRRQCIVFLSSLVVLFERNLLEWGAIIFGGNFMVRGNLPRGNFPRGRLSGGRGAILLGGQLS